MHSRANDAPHVRPASDSHLAIVTSVKDVGTSGRIQVRLLDYDGVSTQDAVLSARVCVPFAGADRGAFLIPEVNDEVIVTFVNGDPRQAVVIGAVWNGRNQPHERLGGDGEHVDRWTFVGKDGSRIAIVEESNGALIRLSTSSGGRDIAFCEINRDGHIELSAGGSTLRLDSSGITLRSDGDIDARASATRLNSSTVDVTSGQSTFSGQVTANAVQTPSVIGASYTPGAGNVW